MNSTLFDVEVSIVNHELREGLRACLRSLSAGCEGIAWRATVVDNVSRDGSLQMLATDFPWARVMRNTVRLGFGENHNQVISPVLAAREVRYVLVLNNDAELLPGALAELVRFMEANVNVGAASPRVVTSAGHPQEIRFPFPSLIGHVRQSLRPGVPKPPPTGLPGWLNGACLFLRARALEEVGVFDTRFFMFFEDTDLQARLSAAGWRSMECDAATVLHHGGQTVTKPENRLAMECQILRSRYLYFLKHRNPFQARAVMTISRLVLRARAWKAMAGTRMTGEGAAPGRAGTLARLARYDPRVPLAHERSSAKAGGARPSERSQP